MIGISDGHRLPKISLIAKDQALAESYLDVTPVLQLTIGLIGLPNWLIDSLRRFDSQELSELLSGRDPPGISLAEVDEWR